MEEHESVGANAGGTTSLVTRQVAGSSPAGSISLLGARSSVGRAGRVSSNLVAPAVSAWRIIGMGNACRTTWVKRKLRFKSGLPHGPWAVIGVMSCNHLVPSRFKCAVEYLGKCGRNYIVQVDPMFRHLLSPGDL